MRLLDFNRHWQELHSYAFQVQRVYFDELKNQIGSKYIQLLMGLRRVGKTTLMLQMINHLIETGVSRDSILYYSFDTFQYIQEVIQTYLKISNKNILDDDIYIFFDEIQKVDNWQNEIKIYYDLYPNIKFILSGSSSLFLRSNESLAGRIVTTTIKPLFFEEFLSFKAKEYILEKPKLYESDVILEFEKYLYRQYYDIIDSNLIEAKQYTNDLKNKIIREDARDYFDIKYPDLLVRIFDIIATHPGMTLDYKNLGNDLGVDARTIQTYVYYLEESFLINKVYNYSPNLLTSEKKQKKVYLNSCSFFLGQGEITGELFENYLQNYFGFQYFYRLNRNEVDFIGVKESGDIHAIEVKYREKIKKEDWKGIDYFEKKFPVDEKIIISKNMEENGDKGRVVPLWGIAELGSYS